MSKKLTDGQRKGRECAKAAYREVIRQLDEFECRRNGVEFCAYFHLDCIYDQGNLINRPAGTSLCNVPVFSGAIVRR